MASRSRRSRSDSDIESFINDYYDAWSGTDEDRIMSYYAQNVTVQIPGSLMQGQLAVREQFVRPFITGFPGNHHVVKKTVLGPNVIVVEFTFEAEHKGVFAGHAATEARVALAGCGVYEYDSAKRQITAARVYFDVGTLLKQILGQRDSHSVTRELPYAPTGTISAPVEHLDLPTVIAVSQTISGEMVLEKLLDTLMRAAVGHAGAQRALLILSREEELRIVAEATASADGVIVQLGDGPVTGSLLPEAVLRYVLRTRESVILDDAAIQNPFSKDPYIKQRRARSVFCLPLMNQVKLIGAIYLEHSLTPHIFAPARSAVLKLLASQAAISIENSQLYHDLTERDSRVHRLIDANIIGIFVWHADGRVLDANDELLRIIGYSREDVVSGRLRWTDFTAAEAGETDAGAVEELQQGRGQRSEEREYVRKNGSRVPVLTGGATFEGERDEGVAFVVDLTERKRAEAELRRAYDSFADAQRLSRTGSFITDLGADDHTWSEQTYRIFEFEPGSKVTVQRIRDVMHPDDIASFEAMITRAMTGVDVTFGFRLLLAAGAVKHIRGVAHVIEQIEGRPLFVGALQDVTESVAAEEALSRARSELAHVARVATVNALTASIAHEINQPLSGIITNASTCLRMLNADPPNADGARETARRAIRDGHRAANVIARLRDMFTRREFTLESMDLNEATREVIALSLGDLQRTRIALRLELDEQLPGIMGDRIQLQQVILNLVRNAAEAMVEVDDRPRQLVVRTEPENDTGVRVTVRDAGVGLDQKSAARLFDPFYTTKGGGMGIGLSVSRSIIERHRGRLWAEPNDGPGATFAFSIPVSA